MSALPATTWLTVLGVSAAGIGSSVYYLGNVRPAYPSSPKASSFAFATAGASALLGVLLGGLTDDDSVGRGLLWASVPLAATGVVYKSFWETAR